ncbi:hypothetical protein AB6A68_13780 [Ferrimicrobium acidiphilum]|uniref:Uncharacterized protein n=1 Tax=Ferrimicrobium acidiphilum TaxID=121039 RepID=A0ABV3Y5T8_9ACTN
MIAIIRQDGAHERQRRCLLKPPTGPVAIVDDPADEAVVRQWLAAIAREIPTDLGVASRIEAAASTGISLHLIESSFAVGATQLTFRPNSPNPEGVF